MPAPEKKLKTQRNTRDFFIYLISTLLWGGMWLLFVVTVLHHVDGNGDRQDENIVLVGGDFHPVSVGDAKPFPGDLSHLAEAVFDLVFVIQKIPGDRQIRAIPDLDREAIHQGGDERFPDGGPIFTIAVLDGHRIRDGDQPFLDLAECLAIHVLEHQGLAYAQDFAIHFVDFLPGLIFDVEIVTQ